MMTIAISLAGVASAVAYLLRRSWTDTVLVLVAAFALAGLAAELKAAGGGNAAPLSLSGDGLREAQWRDMPARPLAWTRPASEVMRLDFPRRLALGRIFTLTIHRARAGAARLQVLAENRQVIAEASGSSATISVQWLPPAAELLVLRARLLDGAGKILAEGPVPLNVVDAPPLQVQGRFGAPSFDLRALNELLAASGALLDWQVTLGKTVTRNETARAPMTAPNLLFVDAAWFERAPESARAAMLAQVAQGTPLAILGANAADVRFWQRALQLELTPQPEDHGAGALPAAPFNPRAAVSGAWRSSDGAVWTRKWQGGQISWIGAADWHRLAISEPRQFGMWWQAVLDAAGVRRMDDVVWEPPRDMPLPGHRLEVCGQGLRGDAAFQRRPDKADAACRALWPRQTGWIEAGAGPQSNPVYVFEPDDWPLWQAAQRRDATARYAARTPAPAASRGAPLPDWPFAVLFATATLALWWRERR